ncbi:hypothetical protein JD969_00055 [Planctomycetota bacterium]|nr:hypothetical protein JD969_00055 [Planctomycetota bacterium]
MPVERMMSVVVCLLLIGSLCVMSWGQGETGGRRSERIGTNLNGVTDWSTQYPFNDVFKTSRAWISGNAREWNDKREIEVDEHGWVKRLKDGQIARTIMLVDDLGKYFGGKYVIEYEGKGRLVYTHGAEKIARESRAGRDVVMLAERGGLFIDLVETKPRDYVRNIKVYREGVNLDRDGLFDKRFLAKLDGYSVLRFMDWQRTNDAYVKDWTDRAKVDDVRWSLGKGVPVEVMVALCNETGKDGWFCMPHTASDEYVREFAKVVKEQLDPKLKAYIEHSNEVWNGMFPAAKHAQDEGLKLGDTENRWLAGWQYHSKRSIEIFKIWDNVFGSNQRIVRVMGGFAANVWGTERGLEYRDAYKHVDAFAIAPYFGGGLGGREQVEETRKMSVDEVIGYLREKSLARAVGFIESHGKLAKKYDVEMIAYEGGQHMAAWHLEHDDPVHDLFDRVTRDERMGDLYDKYLEIWKKNGGGVFVHFTDCGRWSKWGRFSVFEWVGQEPSEVPRHRAIMKYGFEK